MARRPPPQDVQGDLQNTDSSEVFDNHKYLLLLRTYVFFSGSSVPHGTNGIVIPPGTLGVLLGLKSDEEEMLIRHLRSVALEQGPEPFVGF